MKNLQAEIITIGDELLIGQVVDTNSAFIAKELNSIGIDVYQISSVSDKREHILKALNDAAARVNVVIITGGLGPTNDDITKKTLAEFTGDRLVRDEATLRHLETMMQGRSFKMNALNLTQAGVLSHADILFNACGTAPGSWFEREGVVFVSMPGVPFEMKTMMTNEVTPRLMKISDSVIVHRNVMVSGIPESDLAIRIADWENNLPHFIRLAYLPASGFIRLRLSARGDNRKHLETATDNAIEALRPLLGSNMLSTDIEQAEALVGQLLKSRQQTVATAESCTGGNIARLITSVAGSSAYFKGSVVSYANEVKTKLLGVNADDIAQYGAVSREVVEQMAANARRLMNVDYALATSGIAGPDGGTADKPVGTVWIALADAKTTEAQCFHFGNNRENNILRASNAALNMLIKKLQMPVVFKKKIVLLSVFLHRTYGINSLIYDLCKYVCYQ